MICSECKRPMNIFTFRLTKSLANALVKIASEVKDQSFNSKSLRDKNVISSSDYTNMSHLKYLGLVEKTGEDGRMWRITERGKELLKGGSIPSWVKVFDNKVTEISTETIKLRSAIGYYEPPEFWRETKGEDSKQLDFLKGGGIYGQS